MSMSRRLAVYRRCVRVVCRWLISYDRRRSDALELIMVVWWCVSFPVYCVLPVVGLTLSGGAFLVGLFLLLLAYVREHAPFWVFQDED